MFTPKENVDPKFAPLVWLWLIKMEKISEDHKIRQIWISLDRFVPGTIVLSIPRWQSSHHSRVWNAHDWNTSVSRKTNAASAQGFKVFFANFSVANKVNVVDSGRNDGDWWWLMMTDVVCFWLCASAKKKHHSYYYCLLFRHHRNERFTHWTNNCHRLFDISFSSAVHSS